MRDKEVSSGSEQLKVNVYNNSATSTLSIESEVDFAISLNWCIVLDLGISGNFFATLNNLDRVRQCFRWSNSLFRKADATH